MFLLCPRIRIDIIFLLDIDLVCFLCYPAGYKGYKVLDLDTQYVSISRNVVFHETVFPFKLSTSLVPDFFAHMHLITLILNCNIPCIHSAGTNY